MPFFLQFSNVLNKQMSTWIKGIFNANLDENSQQENENSDCEMNDTKLTLDKNEIIFLATFVDKGQKEFVFQPENPNYSDLIDETTLSKISGIEINELISSLEKKKILIKGDLPSHVQCPNCYSSDLKVRYRCPRCESDQVIKSEIIEHPYCGYRDKKSEFITPEGLVCPKCNSKLTRKERSDKPKSGKYVIVNTYRINGSFFQCEKCDENINKPDIYFICNNCGTKYDYRNATYQKTIKYAIPENIFNKILNRNNINLLIVEDSEPEAEILSILFGDYEGPLEYNITITNLGADALKSITNTHYDMVIQDLGLPDIDGLELLKEIKKIDPALPVIVYTGYDDRDTAVKAMKIGASEFIIKNTDNIRSLPVIAQQIVQEHL